MGLCGLLPAPVLAGCATTPPSPEALAANDPYEQTSRDTPKRNAKIDKYFVIPTVGAQFILVPERDPAGFRGLLFIPAQPVAPAVQRTDPQRPQTGRRSARLLIRI